MRVGVIFYLTKTDGNNMELKNIFYDTGTLQTLKDNISRIESNHFVKWIKSEEITFLEQIGIEFNKKFIKEDIKRHLL